jgi:hypothetical protein
MRHYENEPRLAICKYADIVPVRATLSELRDLFEHLRLRRSWLEDLHARSDEEVIGGFQHLLCRMRSSSSLCVLYR